MKFKLLKLPDNDYIESCAKTVANEGFRHPDAEQSLKYQEFIIVELVNMYNEIDDEYAASIARNLLRELAIVTELYGNSLEE